MASIDASAQLFPNLGGQRAGISALSFLKSDISPRSIALSGSNISLNADGFSIYHNPAALADISEVTINASDYIFGQGIHQTFIAASLPRKNSSAFGLSVNALNSGVMEVRTEFQPDGTGELFYVSNIASGLTYSKQLSEMFSLGLSLKYVYEQIAEYKNHTACVDVGFLYKTDFKDLKFAVLVQNFGGNSDLKGSFLPVTFNRDSSISLDKFTVPTIFKMGASIIPYKTENQHLLLSFQLDHPNDNAENIRFGAEYDFKHFLFLRAGYKINVTGQKRPSFGVGYRTRIGYHPLYINYGVNPTNYLGMQHVVGLSFHINKNRQQESNEGN